MISVIAVIAVAHEMPSIDPSLHALAVQMWFAPPLDSIGTDSRSFDHILRSEPSVGQSQHSVQESVDSVVSRKSVISCHLLYVTLAYILVDSGEKSNKINATLLMSKNGIALQ